MENLKKYNSNGKEYFWKDLGLMGIDNFFNYVPDYFSAFHAI